MIIFGCSIGYFFSSIGLFGIELRLPNSGGHYLKSGSGILGVNCHVAAVARVT